MSACMTNSSVVAVIPARFQSTRFPGKPLAPILGKPLIQWTVANALRCPTIDSLIVTTDDDRIENTVQQMGVEVVRTDPNCASGTDRIAEVIRQKKELLQASFLVNIQGDEPCIQPEVITSVIHAMHGNEADIGTPISPIYDEETIQSPHVTKCVRRLDGVALYFSRSPIPGAKKPIFSKEALFYRHIGLYVFRPEALLRFASLPKSPLELHEDLEMLRALENGMTIMTCKVQNVPPGVDLPLDIEKVKEWIQHYNMFL